MYVKLIMDKTNKADLSNGVFAILISVTCYLDEKYKIHFVPQISSKSGKQRRNKGSTELHCDFIAADSIADAISFIRCIVLWSEKRVVSKSGSGSGGIWIPKPGQVQLQPDF